MDSTTLLTFPVFIRMLCKDIVQRTNDLIHALNVTNPSICLSIKKEQSLHHLHTTIIKYAKHTQVPPCIHRYATTPHLPVCLLSFLKGPITTVIN